MASFDRSVYCSGFYIDMYLLALLASRFLRSNIRMSFKNSLVSMTMNKIACHWNFIFVKFRFFWTWSKSQVQYIFNLLSAGIMQILGHATMQLLHLKRPKLIEHNVSVFRAQAWNELVRHSLEYPVSSSKRAFCEQWQAWHLPSKSLKPHIPTKAKFGTSKTFWQNRPCFLFFCQDPSALTCSVAIRNFPGRQLTSSDVTTTCLFLRFAEGVVTEPVPITDAAPVTSAATWPGH
jgi:hypothetical protein